MQLLSKITNHPHFDKGLVLFDQGLVSGSNFLLGILLVRCLGLDDYGVFALLWMAVLFALSVNQAFITKPLLSIAPKLKDQEQEDYLANLHFIQLSLSVLFLIAGFIVYVFSDFFFTNEIASLTGVVGGVLCLQVLHDYYRKINFVQGCLKKVILIDGIMYGGQLIGLMVLIGMGKIDLFSTFTMLLVVNAGSVLFGIKNQRILIDNYKDILVRHFHFSKWLLGTAVVQWLSGNYFIIVGASILGTVAVGAIRMVQNVMGLCHVLFLAMENVVPVEAARRFHAEGENALTNYLSTITMRLGVYFGLFLVLLSFFAPQVLALLYGVEAIQYTYVVYAYALLYVFVFLGHPFRFYLRTVEKTYPIFLAYILGALFSLSFAHSLINVFHMNGLLAGLIVTQLLSLIIYASFMQKYKGPEPLISKN